MIARITGKLAEIIDGQVVLQVDHLAYEVLIPSCDLPALTGQLGREVTLHTLHYMEGSANQGNQVPRLVGFLSPQAKAFFAEFIKVKGIGPRKALRAFAMPIARIATAIEERDVKLLATLPDIGKRTAEQIVAQLQGKLEAFATRRSAAPTEAWQQYQRDALNVLLQLGERRPDAEDLIQRALQAQPPPQSTEDLIQAAYRLKERAS